MSSLYILRLFKANEREYFRGFTKVQVTLGGMPDILDFFFFGGGGGWGVNSRCWVQAYA